MTRQNQLNESIRASRDALHLVRIGNQPIGPQHIVGVLGTIRWHLCVEHDPGGFIEGELDTFDVVGMSAQGLTFYRLVDGRITLDDPFRLQL